MKYTVRRIVHSMTQYVKERLPSTSSSGIATAPPRRRNARWPARVTAGSGSTDRRPPATLGHTGRPAAASDYALAPRSRKRPFAANHPRSIVSRDMKSITRRRLLTGSMTAGLALGTPQRMLGAALRSIGPNDAVNVAVIGLGSTTAKGGVGGRGHQLIGRLREIPGVKIVALCDADRSHLDRELEAARDHGGRSLRITTPA